MATNYGKQWFANCKIVKLQKSRCAHVISVSLLDFLCLQNAKVHFFIAWPSLFIFRSSDKKLFEYGLANFWGKAVKRRLWMFNGRLFVSWLRAGICKIGSGNEISQPRDYYFQLSSKDTLVRAADKKVAAMPTLSNWRPLAFTLLVVEFAMYVWYVLEYP